MYFYVVGNGPSLKKDYLELLPDGHWLGMNSAYKYWEKINKYPKYYACLDPVVVKSQAQGIVNLIKNSPIESFFLHQSILEIYPKLRDANNITFLDSFSLKNDLIIPFSSLSEDKQTTGSLALRFVIQAGHKKICLIGVDCNYVDIIEGAAKGNEQYQLKIDRPILKNQNYFFPDYQSVGDLYQIPNPKIHSGNLHLQSFVALKNDIHNSDHHHDIDIVVGSPKSLLSRHGLFKTVNFRETLNLRKLSCIAVPMTEREVHQFILNLRRWADPRFAPSLYGEKRGTVIHIFLDGKFSQDIFQQIESTFHENQALSDSFDGIKVTFLTLPDSVNFYHKKSPGGAVVTKSGPNVFFLSVMKECSQYEYTIQLETDCVPIRAGWLDAAEFLIDEGLDEPWIIGPAYYGPSHLSQAYQLHINGNAIYATGSEEFQSFLSNEFLDTLKLMIQRGINDLAYDTTLSLALANSAVVEKSTGFKIQKILPHIRYTDFIANLGGARETEDPSLFNIEDLIKSSSSVFMVHGRAPLSKLPSRDNTPAWYVNTKETSQVELSYLGGWINGSGNKVVAKGYGVVNVMLGAGNVSGVIVFQFGRSKIGALKSHSELVFRFRCCSEQAQIDSTDIVLVKLGEPPIEINCSYTKSEDGTIVVSAQLPVKNLADYQVIGGRCSFTLPCSTTDQIIFDQVSFVEKRLKVPLKVSEVKSANETQALVKEWEKFVEEFKLETNSLSFVDFRSNQFLLIDSKEKPGFSAEFCIRKSLGLSSDDTNPPLASATLTGSGFEKFKQIEITVDSNQFFGAITIRVCRNGETNWEYVDMTVIDRIVVNSPFTKQHTGIRVEILQVERPMLAGQIKVGFRFIQKYEESPIPVSRPPVIHFPRILIIDSIPTGSDTATGQIKKMFFEGWPQDRLLQVYENAGRLQLKYFSATEKANNPPTDQDILIACSEFQPDAIYFRPADSEQLLQFAEHVISDFGCPVVTHIMDDWPDRLRVDDPNRYARVDPILRRILKLSSSRLSICQAMSDAYLQRYGHAFTPLANGVDSAEFPAKDWSARPTPSENNPFVIRYMGGLADDMTFASVVELATAVSSLSTTLHLQFEIYTMPWYLDKIKAQLATLQGIKISTLVSSEDYPKLLTSSDALVIAYNFNAASIRYVGLSFANKLPEVLASGVPVLAYGPKVIPTIEFLEKAGCAQVITARGEDLLKKAVASMYSDPDYCQALGKTGRELAVKQLSKKTAQEKFRETIFDAVGKDTRNNSSNSSTNTNKHGGMNLREANNLFRKKNYQAAMYNYVLLRKSHPLKIYADNALMCAHKLGLNFSGNIDEQLQQCEEYANKYNAFDENRGA